MYNILSIQLSMLPEQIQQPPSKLYIRKHSIDRAPVFLFFFFSFGHAELQIIPTEMPQCEASYSHK